ncbi:pentatricopeptide repeat-containing protein [Tanacetum coccineum]
MFSSSDALGDDFTKIDDGKWRKTAQPNVDVASYIATVKSKKKRGTKEDSRKVITWSTRYIKVVDMRWKDQSFKVDKRVWFEVELHGVQGNLKAEGFQVSNNDTAVAQKWLEDKQAKEKTNTDCLVKEREKGFYLVTKMGDGAACGDVMEVLGAWVDRILQFMEPMGYGPTMLLLRHSDYTLICDEDLTDEDGDIGMGDSTSVLTYLGGEVFSGGKKSWELTSVEIMVCVLKACREMMNVELGEQVHGWLMKSGYLDDLFMGSSLITFYGKVRCFEDGDMVFDLIGSRRNVVVWTARIINTCKEEQFHEVFEVFNEMGKEGVSVEKSDT